MVNEKSRAILATLVGAVAIARSIESEEEIGKVLMPLKIKFVYFRSK